MTPEIFVNHNILRLRLNFVRWMQEIEDNSPAFKMFIPKFQKNRDAWIYAGRAVDGRRFKALTPAYKAAKKRRYGHQPILIASGRMIQAVRGGPGWFESIGPKSLEMGVDIEYASYHQDGAPSINLPQRNWFLTKEGTLTKLDYAQLLQAMEGKIQEATDTILNRNIIRLARDK